MLTNVALPVLDQRPSASDLAMAVVVFAAMVIGCSLLNWPASASAAAIPAIM